MGSQLQSWRKVSSVRNQREPGGAMGFDLGGFAPVRPDSDRPWRGPGTPSEERAANYEQAAQAPPAAGRLSINPDGPDTVLIRETNCPEGSGDLHYVILDMRTLWALTQAAWEGLLRTQMQWEVTPKSGTTADSAGHAFGTSGFLRPAYATGTMSVSVAGLFLAPASAYPDHPLAALFCLMLFVGSGYIGIRWVGYFWQ